MPKKAEELSAGAVGRVEDEMGCVGILAGGDDDGRSAIADDPDATPPVALEEAEELVVEREEDVVAEDDHDHVAADIASLNRLVTLRIVYSGVPPGKVLAGIKCKRQWRASVWALRKIESKAIRTELQTPARERHFSCSQSSIVT